RKAARDATLPQAEVLGAVERPVAETAAGPRRTCGPRLNFCRHRRNLPFRRIHHEPSAAALAHLLDDPELGGVDEVRFLLPTTQLRRLVGVVLALFDRVRQLTGRDVLESPAVEFARPLERRAVFVLVRVVALQVRIAPRRLPRHKTRGSGLAARNSRLG